MTSSEQTQWVTLVERTLSTIRSTRVHSRFLFGVGAAQSLAAVQFVVIHCLFFVFFVIFLFAIVLYALLRFTAFNYPFEIIKLGLTFSFKLSYKFFLIK
jgi:hypothetical protein